MNEQTDYNRHRMEMYVKEARLVEIEKMLCDAQALIQNVSTEWSYELYEMAKRIATIRRYMTGPLGI